MVTETELRRATHSKNGKGIEKTGPEISKLPSMLCHKAIHHLYQNP